MASSSTNRQWLYDVFINFRGKDTRGNFVSHLHAALSNAGVNAFLDDDKLRRGNQLGPELLRAIEGSQISIVVLSQNYVYSNWCLDELVKIMDCRTIMGQVVLPVFYNVQPSFLRGYAEETFDLVMSKSVDHKWKTALIDTASIAGWDVRNWRNENAVVKDIVDKVLRTLDKTYLSITDYPVGLEPRVQHVIRNLKKQTRGVSIVGIWGMGGCGKSTIAKLIYNKLHHEFEDASFLANIREVWEKDRGQIDLQEQLLSDILKTREMKVHSIEWGKATIRERLSVKRALVVLDDVNKSEQLNALCGNRKGIGSGSVIIITTRDIRLLKVLDVDYVYEVEGLNVMESLELFSWHSFREATPREGFLSLSKNVVAYCGGLPLALEVIGSYLYMRSTKEWQCVLSKLTRIPDDQIQEKLKISFDGLRDHMEKDIFLDICCFFIHEDIAYVTDILNGCGLHADIGIKVLVERSLIKIERNNKLGMHDLLRDMGREIVRDSSEKKLEKPSRLWFHEDVLDVLTKNTGTEAIEGLSLKLPGISRYCFNVDVFKEMERLRLLQVDNVNLIGDYGDLSKQLRWISWKGFSLKYMPDKFYLENVVAIDIKHSNLQQVWKLLEKLKILNLSHSRNLIKTPDFSNLPNLEKLILEDCSSLCNIHQSIGDLCNLILLNLKDCTNLSNLPRVTYKLKSLKTLIISGCSKIDKLEEDIVQMESLTTLIAENTAVKQVPFSIVRSKSIGYISLCGYEGLAHDVFPSLIWSWMSPTMKPLSSTHHLFGAMSLVSTNFQNNCLEDLSAMLSGLSSLRSVQVQCNTEFQLSKALRTILDDMYGVNHTEFEIIPYVSPISNDSVRSYLIGMGSYLEVFNTLRKSISEVLTTNEPGNIPLTGDNNPHWLTYAGEEGHSVLFTVPQVRNCHIKGMTLCVIYSSNPGNTAAECLIGVLMVNYTKCVAHMYKRDTTISFNDDDWQGIVSHLESGDKVEIFVIFGNGLVVKKTAAYLIYDESIDMEMNHESTNTEPSLQPRKEATKNVFLRFIKKLVGCM
ncbi:disease resistance protein RUN1-like isoform X2 [Lotus japonicus]|uniref:disease resistance protein RUN1-like isoform X2 n=1 Tax=Lotus japonicus TaxID=34305 RepID=UPI0025852A65|nr:disease resistance protein RUN1-like isoform X2 [Lotus japonicus]